MQKDKLSNKNEGANGPLFRLTLEEIRPYLLNPNLKDDEIVRLIHEMSSKFTVRRDQISDYVQDEDRVSAYTALYLPTNIPKLQFLFDKLPQEVLDDLEERPFIDIGCGPGTFSLAWSLMIKKAPKEIIAVDSSKKMLEQANNLFKGFFPDINLTTANRFHQKKSDAVLFFGHSINELGVHNTLDHIVTIDPEYVIWIEPGTSELFKELKKLRQALFDHFDVLYPCPSLKECPADWCHQVMRTTHEHDIERLCQLSSLDRKILPMSAHIYRRKKLNRCESLPTTIRFINETKFSFEYEVCHLDNGEIKNDVIEISKKQLTKAQEKQFKNADVGEKIDFEVEKKVQNKFRVRLRI